MPELTENEAAIGSAPAPAAAAIVAPAISPAISVVIGVHQAAEALSGCLAALHPQTAAADAEIIVAQSGAGDGAGNADLARRYPQVRWLHSPAGTLVPQLWKQGLDAARGPLVALTIAQCRPSPTWLQQIAASLSGGAAAVGGPLTGPEGGSSVDWALYFARYSAWMPAGKTAPVHDVAGDNAAYRRAALEGCEAAMRDGFWEVLVHQQLVAQRRTILWEPAMLVEFHASGKLRNLARTRYEHGRHYASTRQGNRLATRALRALTAPALPLVLLARIHGRIRARQPAWLRHFWRSLPALSVLVAAWSLGELSGYIRPQP
jgi:hypothetical protein